MLANTVTPIVASLLRGVAMSELMRVSKYSRSVPSVCDRCSVPKGMRALAVGIRGNRDQHRCQDRGGDRDSDIRIELACFLFNEQQWQEH